MAQKENGCTFKVPKIKSKENLERISLTSEQFQKDIAQVIVSNFKKPFVSEKVMNFTSAWMIHNPDAEERHFKCRKKMRQTMPLLSYSVGFLYIENLNKLHKISKSGKISNGNIAESRLATSSMGVSLCQFSDIYHSGDTKYGVPNEGILLVVKYLKGKINYVPCDLSPMDPQPDFDCHMVKSPTIDTNMSSMTAFHQTQIFIYEYTEDGEIIDGPSQILPFAAVKFNWNGTSLFKKGEYNVRKSPTVTHERIREVHDLHEIIENQKYLTTLAIHQRNASSIVPFHLSFSDVEMECLAHLYLTNPVASLLRSDVSWQICGVMEVNTFEKELKQLQINWNNIICPSSSSDLLDPLSNDLIISLNRPNLLSSAKSNGESPLLNESQNVPQFVTYTRIVLKNLKYALRLSQYFNLTKLMGFINRPFDSDLSILIFPDGTLSKKLGIPTVEDTLYFHGLIFHSQHPQFIILNPSTEKKKEKEIYFSNLSMFKKQCVQSKFNILQPLINYEVLKQTVKLQAEVQKAYLYKLVKPQHKNNVINYKPICFENECLNHECEHHNPIKKIKVVEITNKENIATVKMSDSSLFITNKKLAKERQCLSERLFDYIKNTNGSHINAEGIVKSSVIGSTNVGPSTFEHHNHNDVQKVVVECVTQNDDVHDVIMAHDTQSNEVNHVGADFQTHTDTIYQVITELQVYNEVDDVSLISDTNVNILQKPNDIENISDSSDDIEILNIINDNVSCEIHEMNKDVEDGIRIEYKNVDNYSSAFQLDANNNGSFLSLDFKTYNKAGYLNYDTFDTFEFDYPTSSISNISKDSTKVQWSLHMHQFKKVKNWPGLSVYE